MKLKSIIRSTSFLAIIACVLWATAFVAIKIGLQYNMPFQFAGIRFFISGLLIIPFIPNLKENMVVVIQNFPKILLVAFVQTFLQYAFFYKGMNLVPGALGAMIIGSGPLFVAVVAHLLMPNDKLTRRKVISIVLGLMGIVIISFGRNKMGVAGPLVSIGILILIGNNILGGLGNILVASDKRRIPPLVFSSLSMIIGGVSLFILGLVTEGYQAGPFPTEYYLSLGWLSFLSAAAFSIWYTLLRRPGVKVSDLNMWKFIVPLLGAVLSWILLPDENPTFLAIVGMVLIALSLVALNWQIKKRGL
ncbi:MAG: DMT family transporter [Bacteroidales bacterium]|nr:DMT family transporter [Bacteroidales bacterium]MDY0198424.1 DMT family transporter [Tenuifilaceae bacterium]